MPEQDKEKVSISSVLLGETLEEQDREGIAVARSNILEITRERKGLPVDPPQLDVDAISQLKDAQIVDDGDAVPPSNPNRSNIINISNLRHPERLSVFPLSHRARRLRKLKKAA